MPYLYQALAKACTAHPHPSVASPAALAGSIHGAGLPAGEQSIDLRFIQPDGHERTLTGSDDDEAGRTPLFSARSGGRMVTGWPGEPGATDLSIRPLTPLSELLDRPLAATLKAIVEDEAAIPHHREIALRTLRHLERVQADTDADIPSPPPAAPRSPPACDGKPASTQK